MRGPQRSNVLVPLFDADDRRIERGGAFASAVAVLSPNCSTARRD
ncbi:hypothetical protein [Sphaerisporangium aureirubrum]|uniref:Uncharacterized protein n=1 Tax=Sphaerisporangium aureirubrum TaxID=1544736 RepID=A0ABW1NUJ4_9ACTN